jgi:hypothetical protein
MVYVYNTIGWKNLGQTSLKDLPHFHLDRSLYHWYSWQCVLVLILHVYKVEFLYGFIALLIVSLAAIHWPSLVIHFLTQEAMFPDCRIAKIYYLELYWECDTAFSTNTTILIINYIFFYGIGNLLTRDCLWQSCAMQLQKSVTAIPIEYCNLTLLNALAVGATWDNASDRV